MLQRDLLLLLCCDGSCTQSTIRLNELGRWGLLKAELGMGNVGESWDEEWPNGTMRITLLRERAPTEQATGKNQQTRRKENPVGSLVPVWALWRVHSDCGVGDEVGLN